jgi:hypothetical protein
MEGLSAQISTTTLKISCAQNEESQILKELRAFPSFRMTGKKVFPRLAESCRFDQKNKGENVPGREDLLIKTATSGNPA